MNESDADQDVEEEAFLSFKDIYHVVPFVSRRDDENNYSDAAGARTVVVQKDLIGTKIQLTLDRMFFKRRHKRHQWFQIAVKDGGKTLERKSLLQVEYVPS